MDLIIQLVFVLLFLSLLAQLPAWFWAVLIALLIIIGVRNK
jgi:hypothetical protein